MLLYAAGMNGHYSVLGAMGAALGDAAADRTRIDECELILIALSDLTDAHASLLRLLSQPPDRPADDGGGPGSWTQETLLQSANLADSVGPLILAALVSRGLALIPPLTFGTPVHITTLGGVVLEVLETWEVAKQRTRRRRTP